MHFGSSLLGVKACSILSGCHDQRAANLVCQVHFCKLLNQSKHLGRTSLNCFKRFIPTIVFLILIWNLCNLCMYTKKKMFWIGYGSSELWIYLGRFYKKKCSKSPSWFYSVEVLLMCHFSPPSSPLMPSLSN